VTNEELKGLIQEFVDSQPDDGKGESWATPYEQSREVMSKFRAFLRDKGKRI